MDKILVLNSGSSSIKFAIFDRGLTQITSGIASSIGQGSSLNVDGKSKSVDLPTHEIALQAIIADLSSLGFQLNDFLAAGHRVVHGGRTYTSPELITPNVIAGIEACSTLAPLHNPSALMAIRALSKIAPKLLQSASFDTAFHATMPEVSKRYAIPLDLHEKGMQRYGFHGLSYASLVESFSTELPSRLLAFHLGNGASICAILNGQSQATTMGYSPNEGLTMGTRSGSLDATIALRLAREQGADEAEDILNSHSGLLALAGSNDMASLQARSDQDAQFAVDHFCYWAARHAGSMCVAMGGVDAVAFTGGIGENSAHVRDEIMRRLRFLGTPSVHVIQAQEERQIAQDTLRVMEDSAP